MKLKALGMRVPEKSLGVIALFAFGGMILALMLSGILFLSAGAQLSMSPDHTYILTDAQVMLHHASLLFNHDLGYPFGADNYYFPRPDVMELLTLQIAVWATHNVFEAVKVYYFFTISLVFLSCFVALLWLEIDATAALLAALAYGLLPYSLDRFSHHDYLTAYYAAPLGAALALRLTKLPNAQNLRVLIRHNLLAPMIIASLVIIAWSGIYYAFYSVFFLLSAGAILALSQRKSSPLIIAVAQSAVIIVLLGAALLPYFLHGESFPERAASDQYAAAIRIPDILRQFQIGHITKQYQRYLHTVRPPSEGADFWPGRLLSIVVLFSPCFVFAAAQMKRTVEWTAKIQTLILAATLIVTAVLFGLPESYGYMFNMLVTATIRSQNRAGVFVAFYALMMLLPFYSLMQTRLRSFRCGPILILLFLAGLNAWPQIGYAWQIERRATEDPELQAYRTSIRASLVELHNVGANAVLQLPVAGWPEVPDVGDFTPANHLWFYIYDSAQSSIKWSYGLNWKQPEFLSMKNMAASLEAEPANKTWAPVRCLGFDAVVIEKIAYAPVTLVRLKESLRIGGAGKPIYEDPRRVVFSLAGLPRDMADCQLSHG